MFEIFRPAPRHTDALAVEGVEIPGPEQLPPPDKRPVWVRFIGVIMVVIIVGMFAVFVITGVRAITSMMYTIPMMLMMLVMHLGMSHGQSGGSGDDIDAKVEEYDLSLREARALVYEHGRAMHDLRTMCFPHPSDLASLVGTDEMWQADPNPDIGRVVPPDAESDPDVKYLTANPHLRARVGIGVAPLYPKLKAAKDVVPEMLEPATMVRYRAAMNTLPVVANLPIDVRLHQYPAYGMRGDEKPRLALVRAMLMSLAFNHSPAILNIGIVTDDPDSWQWIKWLPHNEDVTRVEPGTGARQLSWRSMDEFAVRHAKAIEQLRGDVPGRPPHLLLVVDLPDQTVSWPQNMTGGVRGITVLVARYGGDLVSQKQATILLHNGRVSTPEDFDAAVADSASVREAETFARAMYRYRPRNYGSQLVIEERDERIPDFFEAIGIADIETHDIVKVWRENAYTDELRAPYGYIRHGDTLTPEVTSLDFTEANRDGDGPHAAVVGQTGSGKSYFLFAVVLSLISRYGPDKLALILADFKGGSTFIGMKDIPQVVANISNLESATELVDRLGDVLSGEVIRRETLITEQRHCKDIYEYRQQQKKHQGDPDWPAIPYLIVIIDECGEFLKERKDYQDLLFTISRVGRSLGMHLFLGSQFLTQAVIGNVLSQLTARFALSVQFTEHSTAIIKTDAAANMVKGKLKGKILRLLPGDAQPVEVAAFHHEGEYVRRTAIDGAAHHRSAVDVVTEPVMLFDLFADREFTPTVDGEVKVREEKRGEQMGRVLLRKISRLEPMRNPFAANMWQRSLRDPMTIADLGLDRQTSGLSIRVGDIDVPRKQIRIPWNLEFDGNTPHFLIAGGAKSGRTTMLQQMVVAGCLQHEPHRLMFMLMDFGTGKLGEVRGAPNVGAYAQPGDGDMVERIIGEMIRLISVRTAAMVDRKVYSVDAYLDSKELEPVDGDPYGYVIVALDGIEKFYGDGDRKDMSAKLLPALGQGGQVGVHLVVTVDGASTNTTGNYVHYTLKFPGTVQLPSHDYSGAAVPAIVRTDLPKMIPPVGQPGRSVQVFPSEGGTEAFTTLKCRTAIPLTRKIEPDRMEFDREVYDVHDYGPEIARSCEWLRDTYADQIVPPVQPAPSVISYDDMWKVFAPLSKNDRFPSQTMLPLGPATDTLSLTTLPETATGCFAQNLLVYGERGCGKTSSLRMVMESVMRQFTVETAMVFVIDKLKNLLAERDALYERGFIRPAKYDEKSDGSKRRLRPPGYVTSVDDIKDLVELLVRFMGSRRPSDDATAEQLADRTYFTGPEIYVFVDNFTQLTSGHLAKSVFDEVEVGGETVSSLLATGIDFGVHFIVSNNAKFADQLAASPFLQALRDAQQTPILQLSAPPASGSPIRQAYHLKPQRWRPGRGRLIISEDEYTPIQVALYGQSRS